MADRYFNQVVVHGSKDEVEDFQFRLTVAYKTASDEGVFSSSHYLYRGFGYPEEAIRQMRSSYIKGSFTKIGDVGFNGKDFSFFFQMAYIWPSTFDGLPDLLRNHYRTLKAVFFVFDPDSYNLINTDEDYRFFPYRFALEEDFQHFKCFEDEDGLISYVVDQYRIDDASLFDWEHNRVLVDANEYLYFHEFRNILKED